MNGPRYEVVESLEHEQFKGAVKVKVIDSDGCTIAEVFGDKIIEDDGFAEVFKGGQRIAVLWKDLTRKEQDGPISLADLI